MNYSFIFGSFLLLKVNNKYFNINYIRVSAFSIGNVLYISDFCERLPSL